MVKPQEAFISPENDNTFDQPSFDISLPVMINFYGPSLQTTPNPSTFITDQLLDLLDVVRFDGRNVKVTVEYQPKTN